MQYEDLSDFTRGYVDAMLFTECHCDNPELEEKGFSDFAPETLDRIIADCAGFEMTNARYLANAYAREEWAEDSTGKEYKREPYTPEQAGHDFWLTRNGHGAGFWDRGLGDTGKQLTNACGHGTRWQSVDLYAGDDGKLYIM